MGSLPQRLTINLNAATASVLVYTFQLSDVPLTVNGAPPGSWECMCSKSKSKAPICTPPVGLSFAGHVRVMSRLTTLVFDATIFTCVAVAVAPASNAICTSPCKKARQFRVRQNSGWTGRFPYAHSSDTLHKRKCDTVRTSHITYFLRSYTCNYASPLQ